MSGFSWLNHSYSQQNNFGAGLYNEGNTCYLNSVLQALARQPFLSKLVKIWCTSLKLCDTKDQVVAYAHREVSPLWQQMQALFSQILLERRVISTSAFRHEFHRRSFLEPGDMHDVAEFFLNLLSIVQKEEGKRCYLKSKIDNKIKHLPSEETDEIMTATNPLLASTLGHSITIRHCERCGSHKKSVEEFYILSLPMPPGLVQNGFSQSRNFQSHQFSKWDKNFRKFDKTTWIMQKRQLAAREQLHNVQHGKIQKSYHNPHHKFHRNQFRHFSSKNSFRSRGGLYGGCYGGMTVLKEPETESRTSSPSSGYGSAVDSAVEPNMSATTCDAISTFSPFIGPLLPSSTQIESNFDSNKCLSSPSKRPQCPPSLLQTNPATTTISANSTSNSAIRKKPSTNNNSGTGFKHWPYRPWRCPKFRRSILGTIFSKKCTSKNFASDPKSKYSVRDLLDHYSALQRIDGLVECSGCGEGVRSPQTKRSFVVQAPLLLVVQIGRFSWNSHLRTITKDRRHISLSEYLSFPVCTPCHLDKEEKYQLTAVICHLGEHTHSGHYKCYVSNPQEKSDSTSRWLLCDDESVKSVSWNDVASAQAYLLFYMRM